MEPTIIQEIRRQVDNPDPDPRIAADVARADVRALLVFWEVQQAELQASRELMRDVVNEGPFFDSSHDQWYCCGGRLSHNKDCPYVRALDYLVEHDKQEQAGG